MENFIFYAVISSGMNSDFLYEILFCLDFSIIKNISRKSIRIYYQKLVINLLQVFYKTKAYKLKPFYFEQKTS